MRRERQDRRLLLRSSDPFDRHSVETHIEEHFAHPPADHRTELPMGRTRCTISFVEIYDLLHNTSVFITNR